MSETCQCLGCLCMRDPWEAIYLYNLGSECILMTEVYLGQTLPHGALTREDIGMLLHALRAAYCVCV